MSKDRNTRSKARHVVGSNFNPIRDELPQAQMDQASNNDDLSDVVLGHPNNDDLQAIGIANVHDVAESSSANHRQMIERPFTSSVASMVSTPAAISSQACTNDAMQAPSEIGRRMGEPEDGTFAVSVGATTNRSAAPIRNTGTIPRQRQTTNENDNNFQSDDARRYDGQIDRVENAQMQGDDAQGNMEWSINVDALNNLWDESLNVIFLTHSKHAIQIRCDLAKEYFTEYKVDLKEKLKQAKSVAERERLSVHREETTQLYLRVQTKLQERLAEMFELEKDNQMSAASGSVSQNACMEGDLKMDRMSIDQFNGDFEQWPKFKDEFVNFVHNTNKTNTEKILRLKRYLVKGSPPYELISGFQSVGDNYEAAWAALRNEYDDDRKILEKKFRDWYCLPHVGTPPSKAKMVNLVVRTSNMIESMPDYDIDTRDWGFWMVPLLMDKLDEMSRAEWAMKRPQKVKPELQPLLQFIKLRSDGVEEANQLHYRHHFKGQNNGNQNPFNRNNQRPYTNAGSNAGVSAQPNVNTNANARQNQNANQNANRNANSSGTGGLSRRQRMLKCPDILCEPNNDHKLFRCPRFKSLTLEQRTNKVRALGVCQLCLKYGCQAETCSMNRCDSCNVKHNSLLCPVKAIPPQQSSMVNRPLTSHCVRVGCPVQAGGVQSVNRRTNDRVRDREEPASENGVLLDHGSPFNEQSILGTALITVGDKRGNPITLRALYDPGSEVNLITTEAYQRLRMPRSRAEYTVTGVGGVESTGRGMVNLLFHSRFESGNRFELHAIIIEKVTTKQPAQSLDKDRWPYLNGLALADPNFNIQNEIDVLLGAAVCGELDKSGMVRGGPGQPIARCTRIGWIVYGRTEMTDLQSMDARLGQWRLTERERAKTSAANTSLHIVAVNKNESFEDELDKLLEKFWELERVPRMRLRSDEQQFCEDHFVANTKRDEDGRYVVKLPIDPDAPKLGDSRTVALRRFLQMEQRFVKCPELKSEYVKFMSEYLQLGHMQRASPLPEGKEHYYIPHHAAGTKKFRVVFDGSSKTKNGVALNDIQMTGEKLQSELTAITMRFRTNKVALTADIKKMYRQVKIDPQQLDYQRILWRDDHNKPIEEYQLTTQTYGLRSAPHNCIRALMQCATDYESEFQNAAEAVRRDFYVDDFISGAANATEALELRANVSEMLNKAGFELAKWTTNSAQVYCTLENEDANKVVSLDFGDEAENSVLGLCWRPSPDAFRYKISTPTADEKMTKRKITSYAARLYDPNGYVAPVTLTAKIMIQRLWASKCGWDSKVPEPIAADWRKFVEGLPMLEKLKIPRWIGTRPNYQIELHGFSDASELAYGCALYIKVTDEHGSVRVNLVTSRTRVAPIKKQTIPRLELCGAHIMAKMVEEVSKVHGVPTERRFLWTDSMIVLHWLNNSPRNAKVYVAHRIAETKELSAGCTWNHVRTDDNPADLASRGVMPGEIVERNLWWHGPDWLKHSPDRWPKTSLALTEEHKYAIESESVPPTVHVATIETPLMANCRGSLLSQYSSARKLYRITAYVRRFVRNCRVESSERTTGPITVDELVDAECMWIVDAQKRHFPVEYKCCTSQPPTKLPKQSKLAGLAPYVDEMGMIRLKSRLQNANLPRDVTNPIAMTANSYLGRLIVVEAHKNVLHGGTQATIQYVRNKYWMPKLRNEARGVIHKCVKCARHRNEPMVQMMGWLPKARVTPGRAFQQTGLDYCGPLMLKAKSGRCRDIVKGYVAVFVCMKTKAVHLEVVSNLTSEAFLAALDRFTSRRGSVHEIYSDNGTTFHGADKELINAVNSWKKMSTDDAFQARMIKWHFIPPVAPHHGGLWEAAVKSAKHHLVRVVGDQRLTYEELATVLAKIEACLNSRPICRLTDDATDNCALTPGHFLAGGPIVTPISRDYTQVPDNRLRRWKLLEKCTQNFWHTWKEECLSQLLGRTKWKLDEANAAVGDIVLMRDEHTPATQWPLGKIVKVYPGPDGLVRTVDVQQGKSVYRRPIVKLMYMPVGDESL